MRNPIVEGVKIIRDTEEGNDKLMSMCLESIHGARFVFGVMSTRKEELDNLQNWGLSLIKKHSNKYRLGTVTGLQNCVNSPLIKMLKQSENLPELISKLLIELEHIRAIFAAFGDLEQESEEVEKLIDKVRQAIPIKALELIDDNCDKAVRKVNEELKDKISNENH